MESGAARADMYSQIPAEEKAASWNREYNSDMESGVDFGQGFEPCIEPCKETSGRYP